MSDSNRKIRQAVDAVLSGFLLFEILLSSTPSIRRIRGCSVDVFGHNMIANLTILVGNSRRGNTLGVVNKIHDLCLRNREKKLACF